MFLEDQVSTLIAGCQDRLAQLLANKLEDGLITWFVFLLSYFSIILSYMCILKPKEALQCIHIPFYEGW